MLKHLQQARHHAQRFMVSGGAMFCFYYQSGEEAIKTWCTRRESGTAFGCSGHPATSVGSV